MASSDLATLPAVSVTPTISSLTPAHTTTTNVAAIIIPIGVIFCIIALIIVVSVVATLILHKTRVPWSLPWLPWLSWLSWLPWLPWFLWLNRSGRVKRSISFESIDIFTRDVEDNLDSNSDGDISTEYTGTVIPADCYHHCDNEYIFLSDGIPTSASLYDNRSTPPPTESTEHCLNTRASY